jgi:hypothetical protein
MTEEIEITQAGVGSPDGCWIWHGGALHQIHIQDGSYGEIHSLRLRCYKGDWILIPETVRDPIAWNMLAAKVAEKLYACQVVI